MEYAEQEYKLADLKPFEVDLLKRVIEICHEARAAGNHPFGCLLADSEGNILPAGALGELTICGEGVGAGYIGLDELTREKFITVNGLKAYRTGDLALFNHDGDIIFRGRMDNQVKLRGLRVELGEIETAINAFPGVSTSIVVMKGPENDRFLAAYFTAQEEIDLAALQSFLSDRLTHYMVPGVYL